MTTTTFSTMTTADLARIADERGVKPSELLPPAGFVQQPDALQPELMSDDFTGPTFKGNGWEVSTYWSVEQGVTFYLDGIRGDAVPLAEAGKISTALAKVAALK